MTWVGILRLAQFTFSSSCGSALPIAQDLDWNARPDAAPPLRSAQNDVTASVVFVTKRLRFPERCDYIARERH